MSSISNLGEGVASGLIAAILSIYYFKNFLVKSAAYLEGLALLYFSTAKPMQFSADISR